ncbi:MAG: type II toxin-antitoxin system prevent-host-death family antitoxin [Verrucomicrobiota bacterium]
MCDYCDYMVASLRDAKARLSELVQKAKDGEEVVIAVRGEPTVRLSPIQPSDAKADDHEEWVAELAASAKAVTRSPKTISNQEVWDELRADRF